VREGDTTTAQILSSALSGHSGLSSESTRQRGINTDGCNRLDPSLPAISSLWCSGRQDALRSRAVEETFKGATLRVLRGLLALRTCLAFSGCVLRRPGDRVETSDGDQSGARG